MLRRARLNYIADRVHHDEPTVTEPEVVSIRRSFGAGYRQLLLQKFVSGYWSARDVCETAWHSTKCGAVGVEDLTLSPKNLTNAHRHLDTILCQWENPELLFIEVPVYEKKTTFRSHAKIPFRSAHLTLANFYAKAEAPQNEYWLL